MCIRYPSTVMDNYMFSGWLNNRLIFSYFIQIQGTSVLLYFHTTQHILPQSSREFDPEAHPELKKPPDPSEISIRRNFRKLRISIRTKIMLRSYIKKWSGDSNSWSGTRFHWSGEKILVFRMPEVGQHSPREEKRCDGFSENLKIFRTQEESLYIYLPSK